VKPSGVVLAGVALALALAGTVQLFLEGSSEGEVRAPLVLLLTVAGLVAVAAAAERRDAEGDLSTRALVLAVVTVAAMLRYLEPSWVAATGAAVWLASPLAAVPVLASWPSELVRRRRRQVLVACWVVPGLLTIALLATAGRRRPAHWSATLTGERHENPFLLADQPTAQIAAWVAWSAWLVLVGALVAVTWAYRWRRAEAGHRRFLGPVAFAALVWAATIPATVIAARPAPIDALLITDAGSTLAAYLPLVGIVVLAGVLVWVEAIRPGLRIRGGRLELSAAAADPDALRDQLAHALDDPSLQLWFAAPDDRWIGADAVTRQPGRRPVASSPP
jgi:hypothetical protein